MLVATEQLYFNLYLLRWEQHWLWTESSSKHSLSLFCSWIFHACNFYLLILSPSIWTCSMFKCFISYPCVTILTYNLLKEDEHTLRVSSTNFQTDRLNGKVVPVHVIRVYKQSSGIKKTKLNSVALVRERTTPTECSPLAEWYSSTHS